jgi:mediator of RNA polymerase II transcription subunit 17
MESANEPPSISDPRITTDSAKCDLIYSALHLLLLRSHAYAKAQRLANTAIVRPNDAPLPVLSPGVLQPILDMLQYEVFCKRVKAEVQKMAYALQEVGISAKVRFSAIGDTGEQMLRMLELADEGQRKVTGEVILRIDRRRV